MELRRSRRLDGSTAGSVTVPEGYSALEPRSTSAALRRSGSSAKRKRGTHDVKETG